MVRDMNHVFVKRRVTIVDGEDKSWVSSKPSELRSESIPCSSTDPPQYQRIRLDCSCPGSHLCFILVISGKRRNMIPKSRRASAHSHSLARNPIDQAPLPAPFTPSDHYAPPSPSRSPLPLPPNPLPYPSHPSLTPEHTIPHPPMNHQILPPPLVGVIP